MKRYGRIALCLFALVAMMSITNSASALANSKPGNKLLIYYGIPESVNNVSNNEEAAQIFAKYDYLVLGDKLELPEHTQHESTLQIIARIKEINPKIQIFGYVDLGITNSTDNLSMDTIKQRINLWKAAGVYGIFLDDAGYDYGVSRVRLNEALTIVHDQSMAAFVNAWHPEDVMSSAKQEEFNPDGLKTKMNANDLYLMESFLLPANLNGSGISSAYRDYFEDKMEKSMMYRRVLGVHMLSVSTIDYQASTDGVLNQFFKMNEAAAGVFSLDGYGVSPVHYSSSEPNSDVVRTFPYMSNYMDFYTLKPEYESSRGGQDFTRDGFRLLSVKGMNKYAFPNNALYQ
ncbi:hypothetical protein [Paenibacillus dauci]|uniref:hypothetical protein n=1 Tax=Paenibacillus dauci TaxID=1567106 RepID=UPI000619D462|nr:hypothetical protein [Paenibacillus dauci]